MGYDITSPSNDRVKWLIRLRDRRQRDDEGVFVVEGDRLYDRAVSAGLEPSVTFTSARHTAAGGEVVTVAPEVLDKASYRSRSQGIIGVFPQWATSLGSLDVGPEPLILVAEDIEKPGNLGAILRTAAAAGVDAVVAVGGTVDVFNPNTIRSSTGAIFSTSVATTEWDELERWATASSLRIVVASPDASRPMWSTDLLGPLALVVGAEDAGVSDRARAIADELIAIPQPGTGVDSLNASVAAAILIYEAVRQRRQASA